jgi:rSAM/selenodomain-associated transferase 1
MARPVLILFARAPRLGQVKRRLAADIGDVPALRFYRNQLGRLLRQFSTLRGWDKIIALAPDRACIAHPPGWRVLGQGPGGLGQRMEHAFRLFPNRRVILVGADIPALAISDIQSAGRALKHYDAVFGPARDGGFYAVAMGPRRPTKPFAHARWSSEHALADTLVNFENFRVAFGRVLQDIDCAEDFRKHFFL